MIFRYSVPLPSKLFEMVTVALEGPKGSSVCFSFIIRVRISIGLLIILPSQLQHFKCGMRVDSNLVVVHVERGSISEGNLQFADVVGFLISHSIKIIEFFQIIAF